MVFIGAREQRNRINAHRAGFQRNALSGPRQIISPLTVFFQRRKLRRGL
jgi:hypothetical protein